MSKAKRIGTAAETAVVEYMKSCGYKDVKRVVLHGKSDEGDIHIDCDKNGVPEIVIEVKSRKSESTYKEVEGFIEELEKECLNTWNQLYSNNDEYGKHGYLVIKRPGKGKVEDWWLCWKEWYYNGKKSFIVRCRLGDFFIKR